MKLNEQSADQLQAVASAARLKPGVLKVLFGELDVEMREDAQTKEKRPVVLLDGKETGLREHLAGLEDGAEIVAALSAGEAAQLDTSRLDNWAQDRYGHSQPARIDTQEQPVSRGGAGVPFPAQSGVQGTGKPDPMAGLDNYGQRRYGHNLPQKGAK